MLVLGIETSCDETAAAVVRDCKELVSSVISSQTDVHKRFGGVVPELASREHLERIEPIVEEAMGRAQVGFDEIDGIAVTVGPGLIGSLLVGLCYAKGLAYALGRPIVGVNHLEGHIYSVVFDNPPVEHPALALIVSGGHTHMFYVPRPGQYKIVARTRDDAAGEAYDKVAKMLGLGYPGGPIIERLAREGDPRAVRFSLPKISDRRPDFSFSGLKTAVSKYVRETGLQPVKEGETPSQAIKDLAASFQDVVIRSLVSTTERVAAEHQPKTLIVAGGVACNMALREAMSAMAERLGIPVYFPSRHLSTDNAAMIAAAGSVKLAAGERAGLDLNADVSLRLQNIEVEDDELRRRVRYRL
ncbi:tRNA (adenosine(37)-N6)-threonylcarbamoyltransferase complex transferase subunit TsaD [Pyrinomonas methylaliphatogenes]|jgi:N6-L-threonylcarbamoyladenine synthase|uniref:tRNA N6-adenosine threonylcarbamoyltransferase n=1 Tax=Pyrinomonas methylaliphatogenes TaxID=454194 RepID=A0A0B6WYY3_9BACT|nr:tRNA (adenosine(37)-N6)-threonylcarbamoyltransferase complex transferase subunit TsaD [Pyrinomonas methylaliphatogenes]MBX5477786.1 tRNA (adenosine(37)-N6)-threonylcarbamoyltransferase complex transferase subunit TsaD [Pyrinomonas methylaliphatogenes]CDM66311.1 O-sialoglycoprotein endopeptidase [Pyrinomonas methylaliphatogenes]